MYDISKTDPLGQQCVTGSYEWIEKVVSQDKLGGATVEDVFQCIRHGLSHGNIWTGGLLVKNGSI